MAAWYFVKEGRREGPVSAEFIVSEMRRGRIGAQSLVWTEGFEAWRVVEEVPELQELAATLPPPLPPEEAPEPTPSVPHPTLEPTRELGFENISQRLAALLIDSALLFVPAMVLLYMLTAIIYASSDTFDITAPDDRRQLELLFQLCAMPGLWLYNAGFESSSWQATPGKYLMKLKVVGVDGGRLSLGRATARFFVKNLTLPFGFVFALFDRKRQTLHDMIARTFVVPRR